MNELISLVSAKLDDLLSSIIFIDKRYYSLQEYNKLFKY